MSGKPLLCLGTGLDFDEVPAVEQIDIMKSVGFDQFFYCEAKHQRASAMKPLRRKRQKSE